MNLLAPRQKKRPLLRLDWLSKGLVYRISVLAPGLSTVLTESRSAISPADNYSPLLSIDYNHKGDFVNLVHISFNHLKSNNLCHVINNKSAFHPPYFCSDSALFYLGSRIPVSPSASPRKDEKRQLLMKLSASANLTARMHSSSLASSRP